MYDPGKDHKVAIDIESGKVVKDFGKIPSVAWCQKKGMIITREFIKDADISSHMVCRDGESLGVIWDYNEFLFNYFAVSGTHVVLVDGKGHTVCLSMADGKELWRSDPLKSGLFASEAEINSLPDIKDGLTNLNRAPGFPVIYQDLAVVPMLGNHLLALSLEDGRVVWRRKVECTNAWERQTYVDEIYTIGGKAIEVFSLATGEKTHHIDFDLSLIKQTFDDPFVKTGPFVISESHVFISSTLGDYFCSIEKSTGKVDWLFKSEFPLGEMARPYIANGRVYFPTQGDTYIFEGAEGYHLDLMPT
jgi:outer membrane protein assembly factor BamB